MTSRLILRRRGQVDMQCMTHLSYSTQKVIVHVRELSHTK